MGTSAGTPRAEPGGRAGGGKTGGGGGRAGGDEAGGSWLFVRGADARAPRGDLRGGAGGAQGGEGQARGEGQEKGRRGVGGGDARVGPAARGSRRAWGCLRERQGGMARARPPREGSGGGPAAGMGAAGVAGGRRRGVVASAGGGRGGQRSVEDMREAAGGGERGLGAVRGGRPARCRPGEEEEGRVGRQAWMARWMGGGGAVGGWVEGTAGRGGPASGRRDEKEGGGRVPSRPAAVRACKQVGGGGEGAGRPVRRWMTDIPASRVRLHAREVPGGTGGGGCTRAWIAGRVAAPRAHLRSLFQDVEGSPGGGGGSWGPGYSPAMGEGGTTLDMVDMVRGGSASARRPGTVPGGGRISQARPRTGDMV